MDINHQPENSEFHQTESTIDHEDAIGRLRSISRRIDSFFESQLEKLQALIAQLSAVHSEHDVTRRLAADLEIQRRCWEREKLAETQRLVEAGELLAAAWAELESKERQINLTAVRTEAPPVENPVSTETSLFEIQMLQQQVAEHSRRIQH